MDRLAELERQLAALKQQNESLRAGRSQAQNQAELLRQQQALNTYGSSQDSQVDTGATDWYSQLGLGAAPAVSTPPTAAAVSPPAESDTVTLTREELNRITKRTEAAAAYVHAQAVQRSLQDRLSREHPEMVNDTYLPVIERVWKARQAEDPALSPDKLYESTITEAANLVEHVRQRTAPPAATHAYGISTYGQEAAPWNMQTPQKQDPNDIFQAQPGNERPEWVLENRALNRARTSKALNVYIPPAAQVRQ